MKDKFYVNFLNKNGNGENIRKLFYSNTNEFFKIIFTFYSPENIEFNFSILDNILYFNTFKKNSLELFINLQKELRKRQVFLYEKDFNYLFIKNILLLHEYIDSFFLLTPPKKNYFYLEYNENNFLIKNTYKSLNIKENISFFKIKNFKNYSTEEKFEKIFDNLINFKNESYINFMSEKRNKEMFQNNETFFREKDIKEYPKNIFESNKKFLLKGKSYIKTIDIYVSDIQKKDFEYLFNILSILFKNKKFKIHIKKPFDEFKKFKDKSKISVFCCYENNNIYNLWWTNETRYILSIKDLKSDLFLLFLKDLDKKILKLKTTKFLTKKDLESFYNTNYYVSRRVDTFIDFLKGG